MKRLVEFGLEQGGSILVEVDEPAADGPVMRGGGRGRPALVEQAGITDFQDATSAVTEPSDQAARGGRDGASGIFEGNTSLLYQGRRKPAAAHDGAIGGGLVHLDEDAAALL